MTRIIGGFGLILILMNLTACGGDSNARLEKEWQRIQAEFTPLIQAAERNERRDLKVRYHEQLETLVESVKPARLCDASRVTYAGILLELDRPKEAESFLLPLASHQDPDLRIRVLAELIRTAAALGDADSLRGHFTALETARGGDLAPDAPLLLAAGNRMRDVDLELALEIIDRGLSYPVPESVDDALYTAIHIRFVDGGLGNHERGVFLDRMARDYSDRARIMAQIEKKRGFLKFLGSPAPELDQPGTWVNRDAPLKLKTLPGRYILLDFFAPWCPDCRNSLDGFRELGRKLGDRLETILVTRLYGYYADEKTPAKRGLSPEEELEHLKAYLKRKQIEMPVFVASDEETHNRFNASAIPHYVLIGPDGTVVDLCMERVHGFFRKVESRVAGE